mmetsp:Transcript_22686/g.55217  ORF Transcript_22686/g.55217 Transcript_22686/m.55217 type:complete len:381 (+) Transcript_22686:116-1258(+)
MGVSQSLECFYGSDAEAPTQRKPSRYCRFLQGHTDEVLGCALSANGKLALSASADKTCILWNTHDATPIRKLEGHKEVVWDCALSADATIALTVSLDTTCIVWNTHDGTRIHTLKGHKDGVFGCALSNNGKLALSSSADGTCILWNTDDGTSIRTFRGHEGIVFSCALSADGKIALSAGQDTTCILWNTSNGMSIHTLRGHSMKVCDCALSADGELALSASADDSCILWNTSNGKPIRTLATKERRMNNHGLVSYRKYHRSRVMGCDLTANGKFAISASMDKTCSIWETSTGRASRPWRDHNVYVNTCAISADGMQAISGDSDTCALWDTRIPQQDTNGIHTAICRDLGSKLKMLHGELELALFGQERYSLLFRLPDVPY